MCVLIIKSVKCYLLRNQIVVFEKEIQLCPKLQRASPECIATWLQHDWHGFSSFEILPMKNISNQSHQFSLDDALEGGLCRKHTGVWTRAYFYLYDWQLWKDMKKRQISPCKNTLLYPLSRGPTERSWDQSIPYKRLDLVYANKCQGISLWMSKSVIVTSKT